MENNTSEREQLEQIRRWWDANGKSLVFGVGIGLAALFGYRYWDGAQDAKALNASTNYQKFLEAASAGPGEDTERAGAAILEAYPDSSYAQLAGLMLARLAVDAKKLDKAREHLQWVIDHGKQGEMAVMARGRLAQLQLAEGDHEAAAKTLAAVPAKADKVLFAELRADVLAAQGDIEAARAMYERAIADVVDAGGNAAYLEMKRDALRSDAPVATSGKP
jgi:predicted negative regulator of RcsB-dependent stress response